MPRISNEWQLQDAKARFSELFRRARTEGPQRVTRHGTDAVIVVSAEEYARSRGRARRSRRLAEFFARSPLAGSGIRLERERDYGRPLDL